MMRSIAVAILLLIAAPASASLTDIRPGAIIIDNDGGGAISTYLTFYRRIENAGVPVRVEGLCISACTLVLALPRDEVCITRAASFGFHLASAGDEPLPGLTAALVARYYPVPIQKWIKANGPLTPNPIYISGAEVIDLGILRECEP